MQNAKCEMQNAKCKIQNAKCNLQTAKCKNAKCAKSKAIHSPP